MIVFGVILLVVAAIFFFISRNQSGKLHAMNAVDTYTASTLVDVHRNITTTLGRDALAEPCEVEGIIETDEPLSAPLSQTPCVAYTVTVTRDYEKQQTRTDAEGRTTSEMVRHTEEVESNTKQVDFWVRDESGRTRVRPEGADLDLKQSKEEYRPATDGRDSRLDFGFFEITINPSSGGGRTLGYKATEQILETGTKVYILGCASDYDGAVVVARHPNNKKQRFMVSRRTERELAAGAASMAKTMLYAAAATGAIGLIVIIIGLF